METSLFRQFAPEVVPTALGGEKTEPKAFENNTRAVNENGLKEARTFASNPGAATTP